MTKEEITLEHEMWSKYQKYYRDNYLGKFMRVSDRDTGYIYPEPLEIIGVDIIAIQNGQKNSEVPGTIIGGNDLSKIVNNGSISSLILSVQSRNGDRFVNTFIPHFWALNDIGPLDAVPREMLQ